MNAPEKNIIASLGVLQVPNGHIFLPLLSIFNRQNRVVFVRLELVKLRAVAQKSGNKLLLIPIQNDSPFSFLAWKSTNLQQSIRVEVGGNSPWLQDPK